MSCINLLLSVSRCCGSVLCGCRCLWGFWRDFWNLRVWVWIMILVERICCWYSCGRCFWRIVVVCVSGVRRCWLSGMSCWCGYCFIIRRLRSV